MKKEYKSPDVNTFKVEPAKCILVSINAVIATEPTMTPDLSRSIISETEEDFWD